MVSPGTKSLRLFIGLWPHEATREAIAQWQRAWAWPKQAALVGPERLHLTLHFLGNVLVERVPDLARAIDLRFDPFTLQFDRGQVWPRGIAVLRPARDCEPPLRALQARLGEALAPTGIALEERAYRPHITLARRADGAQPAMGNVKWRADDGFVLARSLPGGAGYQVLHRFG
jgi:RNA 2',3'-cyclic 3'-phosphodiesterase